jgi:hypothetical protein
MMADTNPPDREGQMSRAYKLPNADATIAEITAAREALDDFQDRCEAAAGTIGNGVVARFRRRGFGTTVGEVVFGLDRESTVLAIGWRYVKTRDAVEPVRGAKGDTAREFLETLQVPDVQPADLVAATGMPMLTMHPGRIHTTKWMHHEGTLYALLHDESTDFRNDQITGDWVQIPLSELYTADEARLAASKPVVAGV